MLYEKVNKYLNLNVSITFTLLYLVTIKAIVKMYSTVSIQVFINSKYIALGQTLIYSNKILSQNEFNVLTTHKPEAQPLLHCMMKNLTITFIKLICRTIQYVCFFTLLFYSHHRKLLFTV